MCIRDRNKTHLKVFVRFLVLIGVLGIVAVVLVGLSLNALVKGGIESMGPRILGVPVTLEDVDIALLSGTSVQAGLTRLVVNNPEEYETAYAVSLPEIRVHVDPEYPYEHKESHKHFQMSLILSAQDSTGLCQGCQNFL